MKENSWRREGRKRLAVDLPNELHKRLMKIAKLRNTTVTKLTIRAILEYLSKHNRG